MPLAILPPLRRMELGRTETALDQACEKARWQSEERRVTLNEDKGAVALLKKNTTSSDNPRSNKIYQRSTRDKMRLEFWLAGHLGHDVSHGEARLF